MLMEKKKKNNPKYAYMMTGSTRTVTTQERDQGVTGQFVKNHQLTVAAVKKVRNY